MTDTERTLAAALRAIHRRVTWRYPGYVPVAGCLECGAGADRSDQIWPCRTAAIIDALEVVETP